MKKSTKTFLFFTAILIFSLLTTIASIRNGSYILALIYGLVMLVSVTQVNYYGSKK